METRGRTGKTDKRKKLFVVGGTGFFGRLCAGCDCNEKLGVTNERYYQNPGYGNGLCL